MIFSVMYNKQAAGMHQVILDPQTEADRSTQHCVISSLRKQFPKVHIIGEEVALFSDIRLLQTHKHYYYIIHFISIGLSGIIC